TTFVLSIANVNDLVTEWSGPQTIAASLAETVDVPNQGDLTAGNYVAVATLAAKDADGDGFGYFIDGSRDQFWLFDIGTDGILKVKYALDYESAWYPPVAKTTIWAIGTAGGAGVGDGAIAISHNFTLTIINGNDADLNEYATTWSGTPATNIAVSETADVANQGELTEANYKAIATFKPLDADGDGFEYAFDESKDGWWLFDFDPSSGIVSLKYDVDYESAIYSSSVAASLWVNGTSGGAPINTAAGAWIPHHFTLNIGNITGEDNINDSITTWSAVATTNFAISETAGVENQSASELATTDYTKIATFKPLDDDGIVDADGDSAFQYAFDESKLGWWLFDFDPSTGIVSLKYNVDYESAIFPPVISATIWINGTAGGTAFGDGTAFVSQNFTLTILNIEEDSTGDGFNNILTIWSGTQPANFAISETAAVDNQGELVSANYVAVATFTPSDEDGGGFEYGIIGDDAYLFDIGSDGILKLKYQLDYESNLYPPVVNVVIWARGTGGGTATGNGTISITHEFTLTIGDINESNNTNATAWSGTQPSLVTVDEDTTVGGKYSEGGRPRVALATFTPSDADGDSFQYIALNDSGGEFYSLTAFTMDKDGVLYTTAGFNYEGQFVTADNEKVSFVIFARGISGGTPTGDAVGAGTQNVNYFDTGNQGGGWITTSFVLSIADVVENILPTEWSGTQPSGASISETIDVPNQGELTAGNYVAVATFTPKDADGDDFEYNIQENKDQFWLFDIGSDGILKVKYALDYESAWYPPVAKTTILARGTSGGVASGDGAVWISQNFTLTIIDGNDTNLNEYATTWSEIPTTNFSISETADVINQGPELSNYKAIATFKPLDADGNDFQYAFDQSKAGWWLFDFDPQTGIVSLKYNVDYESAWYPPVISASLWVNGTSGGAPTNEAVGTWISQHFTLSILDVNDADLNEYATTWSGTPTTDASWRETINVENQGPELSASEYVAVGTFKPLDDDGTEFEYAFDTSKAGFWLFDYDTSTGVISVKYQLDYESAWYPPIVETTLWIHGTSGGTVGDGTAWVSHNFTLSILNVNEAINDEAISWSGNQPATIAVEETAGVDNLRFDLTTSEYVAVATFTPEDADGDEFAYGLSGDYAWMFDIGSDGVLTLKFELDYESTFFDTTNFSATVWAGGLSGGTPVGDAVPWISHNFVLSLVDVAESSTADGGTMIGVNNDNGVYDITFANLNYTNDGTTQTLLTADNFENSFISFTDADGNHNQHHWYFIADTANDGTGYIVFDVDGDDGTGNDQIHIFGDGNWNWGTPSEGDGI
ncbi:MAG: hypothetical protein ACR2PV_02565, partial [Gammaproteobacteria bacterium]